MCREGRQHANRADPGGFPFLPPLPIAFLSHCSTTTTISKCKLQQPPPPARCQICPVPTRQTLVLPSFCLLIILLGFSLWYVPFKHPNSSDALTEIIFPGDSWERGLEGGSVCPQWPAVMVTSRRPCPEVGRGKKGHPGREHVGLSCLPVPLQGGSIL